MVSHSFFVDCFGNGFVVSKKTPFAHRIETRSALRFVRLVFDRKFCNLFFTIYSWFKHRFCCWIGGFYGKFYTKHKISNEISGTLADCHLLWSFCGHDATSVRLCFYISFNDFDGGFLYIFSSLFPRNWR